MNQGGQVYNPGDPDPFPNNSVHFKHLNHLIYPGNYITIREKYSMNNNFPYSPDSWKRPFSLDRNESCRTLQLVLQVCPTVLPTCTWIWNSAEVNTLCYL